MPKLIQFEIPTRVTSYTWLALGAGLAMVVAAFAGQAMRAGHWTTPSSVLLGAGVGIVLAGFGGQATVRGKGFVMAGVAAIAMLLIWILESDSSRFETYARGTIDGVPSQHSLSMRFENPVLGSFRHQSQMYVFAVFHDETRHSSVATLEITDEENDADYSIAVSSDCLVTAMGRPERLHWTIRHLNGQYEIVDKRREDAVIGWFGDEPRQLDPCPRGQGIMAGWFGNALGILADMSDVRAFAQMLPEDVKVDFSTVVGDLADDHSEIRRGARGVLSQLPPEDVPMLIDEIRANADNDRVRLGLTMVLTSMLRADKALANSVEEKLSDEDIELLLDLAGDEDRLPRIYATEFLYDLDSARVASHALRRAADTDDVTARFQWLFLARSGWLAASAQQREEWRPLLEAARQNAGRENPRTLELIESYD